MVGALVLALSIMFFILLTINGNNLCKTFRNRSLGCKPIKVVLEALLESEIELLNKPLDNVK